jgi:prefoldin subunit 5
MTDAIQRAVDLLRARISEVEAERRRLQAALEALTARGAARARVYDVKTGRLTEVT